MRVRTRFWTPFRALMALGLAALMVGVAILLFQTFTECCTFCLAVTVALLVLGIILGRMKRGGGDEDERTARELGREKAREEGLFGGERVVDTEGTELRPCPRCGTRISETDEECPECGRGVESD